MRYLASATVLSVLMIVLVSESVKATGYDVAGKEKCVCSPFTSRGVVPDTLNNLSEALVFPKLGFVVERLALEIKAILGQFGVKSAGDPRGRITETKGFWSFLDKSKKEKKRKAASKKKRRIKVPPRAM